MKVLNLGSLNLDYVYTVDHFVQEGETISSQSRHEFCGGKGLNQSIAMSRAGAKVFHAGCIGRDGETLKKRLIANNVDVSLIKMVDAPTGHAIIQVNPSGQNSIIIYGGANKEITEEDVDHMLLGFEAGDILLLQNETSSRDYAIEKATMKGMKVALNPSPMDDELIQSPALQSVEWFILNEIEGKALTEETSPQNICDALYHRFHGCKVVLTVGENGSLYYDGETMASHNIYRVPVVDTTAAGDTYAGYFLASIASGKSYAHALQIASRASSIAVSRPGASDSIPSMAEVEEENAKEEANIK